MPSLEDALDSADAITDMAALPEEQVLALVLNAKTPEIIAFGVYTVCYENAPQKVCMVHDQSSNLFSS
eukprot:8735775-Pyramimonas_sp.AAC.2